jgi:hypothetical protein
MKFLKSYSLFNESVLSDIDLFSNLKVKLKTLLRAVEAAKLDWQFKAERQDIDKLKEDPIWIKELEEKKLHFSEIYNAERVETFLKYPIKWIELYPASATDLSVPVYLIVQKKKGKIWTKPKMYYPNKDMTAFYNAMTSATIKLSIDDLEWIYSTSNAGKNWELKNLEDKSKEFKTSLYPEELEEILKKKKINLKIINNG